MLFRKRVWLIILAQKGLSIVARVRWQKQTRYMCIFFVLNVEEHQKCFLKIKRVRFAILLARKGILIVARVC